MTSIVSACDFRMRQQMCYKQRRKQRTSDLEKETENIKKNSTSPYPSPPASHSSYAPSKSTHAVDKYKLSAVQSLNAKEISNHLSALKISDDSIQTMTSFYSAISMIIFVGAHGIVSLPIFDPGGATKTKHCAIINRNKMPIAQTVQDNTVINKNQSNEKHDISKLKTILNTEEISEFKSLLSSRMKIRVPLAADESL